MSRCTPWFGGERTIHLPKNCTVYDVFNRKIIAADTNAFTVALDGPETRLFRLSKPDTVQVYVTRTKGGRVSPEGLTEKEPGGELTFTFQAEEGYRLNYLLIDGIKTTVQGDSYTFRNLQESHTVVARYTPVYEKPPVEEPDKPRRAGYIRRANPAADQGIRPRLPRITKWMGAPNDRYNRVLPSPGRMKIRRAARQMQAAAAAGNPGQNDLSGGNGTQLAGHYRPNCGLCRRGRRGGNGSDPPAQTAEEAAGKQGVEYSRRRRIQAFVFCGALFVNGIFSNVFKS